MIFILVPILCLVGVLVFAITHAIQAQRDHLARLRMDCEEYQVKLLVTFNSFCELRELLFRTIFEDEKSVLKFLTSADPLIIDFRKQNTAEIKARFEDYSKRLHKDKTP